MALLPWTPRLASDSNGFDKISQRTAALTPRHSPRRGRFRNHLKPSGNLSDLSGTYGWSESCKNLVLNSLQTSQCRSAPRHFARLSPIATVAHANSSEVLPQYVGETREGSNFLPPVRHRSAVLEPSPACKQARGFRVTARCMEPLVWLFISMSSTTATSERCNLWVHTTWVRKAQRSDCWHLSRVTFKVDKFSVVAIGDLPQRI